MARLNLITGLHTATRRDYVARVVEHDKAESAVVARMWGKDYWDGDRRFGYGGYTYDGRWRPVATAMAAHFELTSNSHVLDVGCGKGYLLYELTHVVPGIQVTGLDISEYALENAKPEIQKFLHQGTASRLPFADDSFDFVYSINTLHNLQNFELHDSLREICRVGGSRKGYIAVESYRTEREKMNLLYWQLTCESFYRPEEWDWLFEQLGYQGDSEFIFFE